MSHIIASYSESNFSNSGILADGVVSLGQCFTSDGSILDSCQFYLKKSGTGGTGTATAKLYAITGTFGSTAVPTGAALATSDPFDPTTTTGSFALYTFTFSGVNRLQTTNGVNYFIVCEHLGQSSPNGLLIGFDDTTPTDPGNLAVLVTGSWTAVAGDDTIFYIYGVNNVSVNLTGVAASPVIGNGTVDIQGGAVRSYATEGIRHDRKKKKVVPLPEIFPRIVSFDVNTYIFESVVSSACTGQVTHNSEFTIQPLTYTQPLVGCHAIDVCYDTTDVMATPVMGKGSVTMETDLYLDEIAALLGE